jgi:hypothetical protein
LWKLLVLGSLGQVALTLSSALAQEPDPARGDFGPVPQVGQTTAGIASGANIYGPPASPSTPIRPSSWPSNPSTSKPGSRVSTSKGTSLSHIPYTDTPDEKPDAGASDEGEFAPCEGTQILARVGSEVVLACEVLPAVNSFMDAHKNDIPPNQIEAVRTHRIQEQLQQIIGYKLIYIDARREVAAESFPGIEAKLADYFDKVEIDRLMKLSKANSRDELDTKFRALGSSLYREKHAFMERTLAQEWVRQKVKFEGQIQASEIVAYYRDHAEEFEQPAQARWEELMVRFSKYPSKTAAYDAIAQMGNEVFHGKSLPEIAKTRSDGPTAQDGGRRDWTTKGSLVATELDSALFGLPVGELSQIIETKFGLHIVRVVERKEASRTPFVEAQVKIRDKIRENKSKDQYQAFVEKLRTRTPVTTVFDDGVQQAGLPCTPIR